ncbi:MAG: YihY/virulence factor BrkB family protein [Rhizobacter sp.]
MNTGSWGAVTSGAQTFWAALNRYLDADGMRQGAAVSFYAAFSMAPLLVVVTGVMVWLLGNDGAQSAMLDSLTRLVGERETRTLSELLARHAHTSAQGEQAIFGSWLALGTTLIGATGVFVELRSAVQAMLGERDGAFTWWRLVQVRLLAIGVVLGCGFLLSVAMVAQTVSLLALQWLTTEWAWLAPVLIAVEGLWSWGVITVIFAMMIRWLPSTRLPWRNAMIGGAVAASLFMVGRYGISLYAATTAMQSALGAAGSFAALLVWVYWSSQIFLLGAALAVELGRPNQAVKPHALAISKVTVG